MRSRRIRSSWSAAVLAAACAAIAFPALARAQNSEPYAPWDGSNPFNCTIQDVGTGTEYPDPDADPFCVEFDKTQQNITELGILDFLANEPTRVAAASPKCFYYQSDHWTASLVQGEPPELWHWDGQYYFDKAMGVGGVNLQNFRVGGEPASASDYGQVPGPFAPYMDQSGGGAHSTNGFEADPRCAALVDTPEEREAIYAGGTPPPQPPRGRATGPCAGQNTITGSASDDQLVGGPGGDRLFALRGDDVVLGARGRDCIRGQRGADRLNGGKGSDRIKAGPGPDRVKGRQGRDRLLGGYGADRITGGPGRDTILAGPGNDRVFARDGKRDIVRCGRGQDRTTVDRFDRVSGCESVY